MVHDDGAIHCRCWIRFVQPFVHLYSCFVKGVTGVLRAYVAMASAPSDRVKANALSIASFVVGLSVGPAIPAVFRPIGAQGFIIAGRLHISMYTAPAYTIIVGCIICSVIMWWKFDEHCSAILSKEQRQSLIRDSIVRLETFSNCRPRHRSTKIRPPSCGSMYICVVRSRKH